MYILVQGTNLLAAHTHTSYTGLSARWWLMECFLLALGSNSSWLMLAGAPLLLEATAIKTGRSGRNHWNSQVWELNQRSEICYYDFRHEENKSNCVSLNFCTVCSSYRSKNAIPSEVGVFTRRHCEALLLCVIAQWLWYCMWLCPRGTLKSPTVSALSHSGCLWHSERLSSAEWWYQDSLPSRWDQSSRLMQNGKNEKCFHWNPPYGSLHTLCS